MTIDQVLTEYKILQISGAFSEANGGRSTEQEKLQLFNRVDSELSTLMNQQTADWFDACLLFSEMSIRKIGGDFVPILAYYYGTKAISLSNLPEDSRIAARRLRLFSLFRNLDKFDRINSLLDMYSSIMEVIGKTTEEHQEMTLSVMDA